jgi:hypothetical protein
LAQPPLLIEKIPFVGVQQLVAVVPLSHHPQYPVQLAAWVSEQLHVQVSAAPLMLLSTSVGCVE